MSGRDPQPVIDLNADVGEAVAPDIIAAEEAVVAAVTSVNIACGGHAGDEASMRRVIRLAARLGVAVGAHPSYPDRQGCGRRRMEMGAAQLRECVAEQVAAIAEVARAEGVPLRHCKPHGALYHAASEDEAMAGAIAEACRSIDPGLRLVGLAGSRVVGWWRSFGFTVFGEAFADRSYSTDGSLRSRADPGAVISDPEEAARRAVQLATLGSVPLDDGSELRLDAETICVHADTPNAAAIAERVAARLRTSGVVLRPLP